ncbi:hypothetical protein MKW92_048704 [Papaver armeniacum]|nr:hypothetical protein MKW92_048704 [Papaver armeniacum]
MGKRGRVQLKRIENKIDRQVTFQKRKPGLIKKANEISVLCDAEVALIVFSPKGELFEYPTDACMDAILERYERQCCVRNWSSEYTSVKAKVEVLQRNQRYNQLLYESISELQRKEKALKEQNTVLGEKIKEKEQELGTLGRQQCNQAQAQNTCPKARTHRTILSRRTSL